MKKNILIIVISIIIVALCVAFFAYTLTLDNNSAIEGEETEVIQQEEISKTQDIEGVSYSDATLYKADKTEVKISDYKDKPIMLLFFNKDNEDSIEVLKKVEDMYKNYEDKIQFFMINTAEEVDEELESEYTIEIYYDFYKETARNYNVTEVPSSIYINELNEIFNAKTGFTTTDALEANLDILSDNI